MWLRASMILCSVMLFLVLSTSVTNGSDSVCQGETVDIENNGIRHVSCRVRFGKGPRDLDGPYQLYVNDVLIIDGQYDRGVKTGLWIRYDTFGNVVKTCDYSESADCVLQL